MKCPHCLNKATLYHDTVWSLKDGKVFQCEHCELLFLAQTSDASGSAALSYEDYGRYLIERGVVKEDDPAQLHQRGLPAATERFQYIETYFHTDQSVLEIGAAAGSFLSVLLSHGIAGSRLYAVEPCTTHRQHLDQFLQVRTAKAIEEIPSGELFDIICLFHVFEHIIDNRAFLASVAKHLKKKGKIIIEVPSSTDPLLTVYKSKSFKDFYFQPVHPFVYNPKSLSHIIEAGGFQIEKIIAYQRYGLGNHLNWLANNTPGGNAEFDSIVGSEVNRDYRTSLEQKFLSDTIFLICSTSEHDK